MSPTLSASHAKHSRHRRDRAGVLGKALPFRLLLLVAVTIAVLALERAGERPLAFGAKPGWNIVSDLGTREQGDTTIVEVNAASRPVFTVFKIERPPRLTIDVANCQAKGIRNVVDVNSWAVAQVAVTQLKDKATPIARLMIAFRRPSHYAVRTEGNKLVVLVTADEQRPKAAMPPQSSAAAASGTQEREAALAAELAGMQEELKQQKAVAKAAVEAATHLREVALQAKQRSAAEPQARTDKPGDLVVRDIRFVDQPGSANVEIQLGKGARPRHRMTREQGQFQLVIDGARLPRLLQRTLDAREYKGPVQEITSFASGPSQVTVQVAVGPHPSAPQVNAAGDRLIWAFPKPRVAVREEANKRRQSASAGQAKEVDYENGQVAAARVVGGRKTYSGRRIDLDFKDADIHNILRLLSDVGNVNIITSDKVGGRVTIRMRNVPWDHALDVILRAKNLGQVREGNLLRVAPIADLEREREAEIARQKQVMLLKPLETRLIPLSYAQASGMLPKVRYMLSPRGKLTFDKRTNMVIARDIAGNLDMMEELIRNLDTQTPQVLIEARIVEARNNYSRDLGIQWGGAYTASAAGGNATGLVFPNQLGIGGGTTDGSTPTAGMLLGSASNPNFAVNLPAATGTGQGGAVGLTLGSVSGNLNINLRLSAAEATGDIRIISSPRITTLDNVQASIGQGVTIPYSQVSAAGVQTTLVDAKLSLTVRPHVTADGSIAMKVSVSNNEPDFGNTGARGEPTILKKEATTEMLVKDGDTTVIGGVYSYRSAHAWSKVPWLAEIPILGYLFRNRTDTSERKEVLVFITPRIINRAQSLGR